MAREFTIRGFNSETGRQLIQYNDNGEWAELGDDKSVEPVDQKIVEVDGLENKIVKPVSRKRK